MKSDDDDYGDIFKAILEKFQCERNREIEESFPRAFSETDETRLFFINEDRAYTDGKNIIVDPAFKDIYKDEECIKNTEKILEWPELISATPWNALSFQTDSQHTLMVNIMVQLHVKTQRMQQKKL